MLSFSNVEDNVMVTLTLLYSGLFLMLQCGFHQYNIIKKVSYFVSLSDVAGVVLFNCGFISIVLWSSASFYNIDI